MQDQTSRLAPSRPVPPALNCLPAVMTDRRFLRGYIDHSVDGFTKGRELVLSRWRFACWMRPFVAVHGGDRRSPDFQDERVHLENSRSQDFKSCAPDLKNPGSISRRNALRLEMDIPSYNAFRVRDEIDRLADAGRCVRWNTCIKYLPLASFAREEISRFTSVRAALAWCKEMALTDAERTAQDKRPARAQCPYCEKVRSALALERKARRVAETRIGQLELELEKSSIAFK